MSCAQRKFTYKERVQRESPMQINTNSSAQRRKYCGVSNLTHPCTCTPQWWCPRACCRVRRPMYLVERLSHRVEFLHVLFMWFWHEQRRLRQGKLPTIWIRRKKQRREEIRNKLHPYLYSSFLPTWCLLTISPCINNLISSVVLLDLDGRGLALYLCVVHLGRPGSCW